MCDYGDRISILPSKIFQMKYDNFTRINGGRGGIRTRGFWLRRPTLYPAELPARDDKNMGNRRNYIPQPLHLPEIEKTIEKKMANNRERIIFVGFFFLDSPAIQGATYPFLNYYTSYNMVQYYL